MRWTNNEKICYKQTLVKICCTVSQNIVDLHRQCILLEHCSLLCAHAHTIRCEPLINDMDFVYESHRISLPKNGRKQIKYNFHDDAFILLMDSQFVHIF